MFNSLHDFLIDQHIFAILRQNIQDFEEKEMISFSFYSKKLLKYICVLSQSCLE